MFLSIDLGTTNIRSAVFDRDLAMLSCESVTYPLSVLSDTRVEQDAEDWRRCALKTLRAAIAASGIDPKAIDALSISSQGIAFVPVDARGEPLRSAISWLDTRAQEECDTLVQRYTAETLYRRTGKRPSPTYTLPKLMWFKAREPELYRACDRLMLPMDYLLYELTGECVTDETMAAGTMLYDINVRAWMDDVLDDLGLDAGKLPRVARAGTPAGILKAQVADALGLRRDVLAVVGAQDQKCAAMGAGLAPGIATVSLGTGGCIEMCGGNDVADPEMRIPCFTYVKDDMRVMEGVISTAASCYRWLRDCFAPDMDFDELNALAEQAQAPGTVRFYPNLAGGSSPHWNDAGGIFAGLTLDSQTGDMARAVMEGVAYKIRENLEIMEALMGRPEQVRVFGGGANSDLWCSIIANVLKCPATRLASSETALAGAAMLAIDGVGATHPASIPLDRRFDPNPGMARLYDAAYHRYEEQRRRYYAQ